jgi:hypothetical protein
MLAVEPPDRIVWRTMPTRLYVDSTEWTIRLEPTGDGTHIIQEFQLIKCPQWWEWIAVRLIPSSTGRDLPIVMGFRAYGGGPFERHGVYTTVWLLVAFLGVCIVECWSGVLVWNGYRSGAVLALVLLPFAGIFWWGFALPFGPVGAAIEVALILVNWRSLR